MPEDPKIKIRNWKKWQSYRGDRGQPPWIKVHRALMRDPNWVTLSDALRGQLVALWLLAADRNGVIPASPELIKKLCFMDAEPDLNVLAEKGFLVGAIPPQRRQADAIETPRRPLRVEESRGEEIREEKTREDNHDASSQRRQADAKEEIPTPPPDFSDMLKGEDEEDPEYVTLNDEDRELAGREMRRLESAVKRLDPRVSFNNVHHQDQMLRIRGAGYQWADVKAVIQWATKDVFWQSKILSPKDLHKHFSELLALACPPKVEGR